MTPLSPLTGQPLCKHYTGATPSDQRGDYAICCRAGVPVDRFSSDVERWPCRRRHMLGVEQHACHLADYRTDPAEDVNQQIDKLIAEAGEPLPEDMAALEKLGNPFLTKPRQCRMNAEEK